MLSSLSPASRRGPATSHHAIRFGQIDGNVKARLYADVGADQHHDWRQAAVSTLDWWRAAGVDTIVDEVPFTWRTSAAPAIDTAPVGSARATVEQPVVAPLPAALADFIAWRTGPDAPDTHWGGMPIAAEGDPAADLMIVLDSPGGEALLDGQPGTLFDRMLAAIGRDRSSIYLVPLAATRPIGGRVPPEAEGRLAELLRHHIRLAGPKRLLILGSAVSRALIGMDSARGRGNLHPVNLEIGTVEAVTSFAPRFLLERPTAKAEAWKDLQLLIGGMR